MTQQPWHPEDPVTGALAEAPLPPLAELVTDEDVRISDGIYNTELGTGNVTWPAMRAALEAYGARLVARLGRTS